MPKCAGMTLKIQQLGVLALKSQLERHGAPEIGAKCQQRLRCKKCAEASAGPTLKHDDDNHVASGLPQ